MNRCGRNLGHSIVWLGKYNSCSTSYMQSHILGWSNHHNGEHPVYRDSFCTNRSHKSVSLGMLQRFAMTYNLCCMSGRYCWSSAWFLVYKRNSGRHRSYNTDHCCKSESLQTLDSQACRFGPHCRCNESNQADSCTLGNFRKHSIGHWNNSVVCPNRGSLWYRSQPHPCCCIAWFLVYMHSSCSILRRRIVHCHT